MKNTSNITVSRIPFAVAHIPEDMPDYWQTLKSFSKAELPVSSLNIAVENLQYLINREAFSTHKQLVSEICSAKHHTGNRCDYCIQQENVWSMWSKSGYKI